MSDTPGRASGRSYYGLPILKEPVWTAEIPWYLFFGGMSGASAAFACACDLTGRRTLARRAWLAALAGAAVSPPLLISDLGRPERFANMLRLFKVTSPMSVGSWTLAVSGTTTGVCAAHAATGHLAGPAAALRIPAATAGLLLSTYTGALLAQTAVPVWREARRELPALFAAGAAASAGAAATALAPVAAAGPARRLTLLGLGGQLVAIAAMRRRLGELARPYDEGRAGHFTRAAAGLTATGGALIALRGARSRVAAVAGGKLVLLGAVCERFAVLEAGRQSARDPRHATEIAGGRQRT